jgi:geranylgeranyl diphosphate synthase type II
MDIQRYLRDTRRAIDRQLDRLLPADTEYPPEIHRAMRYSIFAGGKRLRPVLVMASGECLGGAPEALLYVGAGVEMMHTYSLIHDDLPALDNDDLRRGMPTCHKEFGEATAILAGDALLTRSYQVFGDIPDTSDPVRLAIIREISHATGTVNGMIGGQIVDLESEGKPIRPETLDYIHRSKTGALLTACARCGALAAGADEGELQSLTEFGKKIGLAFQIVDDILDVTATSDELGKTAGKDQRVQKATYAALYGIDASRQSALELVASACRDIEALEGNTELLCSLARFICSRSA